MRWQYYIIAALVLFNAGFMTFDGIRAFVVGDYLTPKSGPNTGQLGLWSKAVNAVGIEPRSNLMKGIHVVQGIVTLLLLACFLMKLPWATNALFVAAIAGLWHLPFGTAVNVFVIVLFLMERRAVATA